MNTGPVMHRIDARHVRAGDIVNAWTQICPQFARVHRVRVTAAKDPNGPGNLKLHVVEILARRLTSNAWVQIECVVGSQVHVMIP